jgi:hypothetical protein
MELKIQQAGGVGELPSESEVFPRWGMVTGRMVCTRISDAAPARSAGPKTSSKAFTRSSASRAAGVAQGVAFRLRTAAFLLSCKSPFCLKALRLAGAPCFDTRILSTA